MAKKKRRIKLPDHLIVIPNKDKAFHEKWYPNRNALDFPHPFRMLCLGPPNVGKSMTIKNIISRCDPDFEKIIVIHCDPEHTSEYSEVDKGNIIGEIPAPSEWDGAVKTLVILDDLDFKRMSKEQGSNLDRLFGYASTHKNISCILCSQDPFNVPTGVRRCANVFVLWRCPDIDSMARTARKTGIKIDEFRSIFDNLMTGFHDSLWIDLTTKSPFPLRKNGYAQI